jgi:hypothetical protein
MADPELRRSLTLGQASAVPSEHCWGAGSGGRSGCVSGPGTRVGPPALVVALGGQPGTDVIDLLEQHWSGADSYNLGAAIRSSGVTHHFASYP